MIDFRDFCGEARPLDDIDLPRLGHRLGVGEDEIHAVIDVEAAGGAWDARGRPKMLFEPHRFYKNLGAGPKRDRAVREGLAYPSWGEKPYPKDSYPRLIQAMVIDETAALKSASWGLGQVLGENHEMVGFDTVQDMVLATLDDADRHLEMMVAFILAAKLDDELRAHDWAKFARGYNGPQYAKNAYHTKLANAFKRWSRIKDTAWSPEAVAAPLAPTYTEGEAIALPELAPIPASSPIGHNGGPALEPVAPSKPLTPLQQMNKPVQGAKTGTASATLGGALLVLWATCRQLCKALRRWPPSALYSPLCLAWLAALSRHTARVTCASCRRSRNSSNERDKRRTDGCLTATVHHLKRGSTLIQLPPLLANAFPTFLADRPILKTRCALASDRWKATLTGSPPIRATRCPALRRTCLSGTSRSGRLFPLCWPR
jgi:hypothetical protein